MKIIFCGTAREGEDISETINSIKNQSIKPDKIIITRGGNIARGRNNYLAKVWEYYVFEDDRIVFTFDSGCVYEKDYIKKMLKCFDDIDTDIAMGIVLPQNPKSLIQEFCALRLPQYFRFTKKDWDNFIPSNRQAAFRARVIPWLGFIPEKLSRADDTYWYGKARENKLKFNYCSAVCYWEMKKSLGAYLKTLWDDVSVNTQYNIPDYQSPKKITPAIFIYGVWVSMLAMITKFLAYNGK